MNWIINKLKSFLSQPSQNFLVWLLLSTGLVVFSLMVDKASAVIKITTIAFTIIYILLLVNEVVASLKLISKE